MNANIPLEITPFQESLFRKATICHIWNEPFKQGGIKVRDHCHESGNFRAAALDDCNLNYKETKKILIV